MNELSPILYPMRGREKERKRVSREKGKKERKKGRELVERKEEKRQEERELVEEPIPPSDSFTFPN